MIARMVLSFTILLVFGRFLFGPSPPPAERPRILERALSNPWDLTDSGLSSGS